MFASLSKATALAVLVEVASAAAISSVTDSSVAGQSTSDVFPPADTSVNSRLFPDEAEVGFPGPTPTGKEPAAAQTAPLYPYNTSPAKSFPLTAGQPHGAPASGDNFDITRYWGNLSPWYSVSSADYGLPDASPLIPEDCTINQMLLLYRHGARYPTSGAAPSVFAQKIANATAAGGFEVSGELEFLSDWTYKLGAELLTPFGRSQNFQLGVEYRQLYGELLDNFTAQGALPVFRTESQDRMVKTAENFAAGFFGVPEYLDQVNIEILVENTTTNNSGAPYDVCNNANIADRGSIGSSVAAIFAQNAFNATLARLNSEVSGALNFTPTDAIAMLQLCSYETDALGYSSFCNLFTQEDFLNYEYYFDLIFYYNNGPGSPVSAAQGKGFLEEWLARLTHTIPPANSALNETFDNSSTYFPLNQSIYADATHEVVVLDTLTAFNFTALFAGPPLNYTLGNEHTNSFVASKIVPFATHFTTQIMTCPARNQTKQIRFLVNDAVIPVHDSHPGCPDDPDGLCPFDTMLSVLQARAREIDFEYDCFADYTAVPGVNYNGRAPAAEKVEE
ncbi:phosphoglycerate mutase-like protein [Hortaea werneckii]|uniref:3-phytase n=1 Tax=Hortaea werneckii TaxID=91943 RepID=A0A3M6X8U2_HORWE|nr:phosphoglycerate mutase-like protein [Hortaea werneckii]KAI6990729.1 phosphoglycerate mutase-like protein [Hortaea werneckii]KAI7162921.1 phosphoglycerate mutase-like protein [Hortaea werneckii]KAI7587938.1 phosphoglycerate mutase-like protein [Hortaea werneckii]KAI7662097.1 phosphoglycerate mutase-like protein [Hortaea werneckii]